ncbi:MAG: hypothetical protein IIB44_09155 [Candidatus Marinimicrobia bacterium]|nr:hypothetical protein [Candidatus Neomarinimicrobiota bacterium]
MNREMGNALKCVMVAGSLLFPITEVIPQEFNGELSGLTRAVDNGSTSNPVTFGLRYIPTFYMEFSSTEKNHIDFEISGNLTSSYQIVSANSSTDASNFKAYRFWLRYSTNRFESRLGLQKINFGPAKLLRALRWFDSLDPQDPLQLAEGVYSLRLRYDFQNNANIWIWGLYGNKDLKGMEVISTRDKSPEYGVRFQYPIGNGEMAITSHNRVIDISGESIAENRIALDGVWDIGVGVFFESALIKTDKEDSNQNWQSFLTLGMDYTFGIGSGLTVLGEHLLFTVDDTPFGIATKKDISGLMMLYSIGLLDQLTYFSFYNWSENLPYHYVSWQRNYDLWIFHVSVFWSRGKNGSTKESQSLASFGQKGIQLTIIFNH